MFRVQPVVGAAPRVAVIVARMWDRGRVLHGSICVLSLPLPVVHFDQIAMSIRGDVVTSSFCVPESCWLSIVRLYLSVCIARTIRLLQLVTCH